MWPLALLAACLPESGPHDLRRIGPPDEPSERAADALEQLRADSLLPVELVSSLGVPSLVYGQVPVDDPSAHPVDQALDFLERYADLFGLPAPAEQLYAHDVQRDEHGSHVHFRQRVGNLPVFNASVDVHIGGDAVYLTRGRWVRQLGPFGLPRIGWQEAFDVFRQSGAFDAVELQGEPRLGVRVRWGDDGPQGADLVWRMYLIGHHRSPPDVAYWRVDLSAMDGSTIDTSDQVATDADKDFDIMTGLHGTSDSCWIFASTDDWFDEDGALGDYSQAADHNGDGSRAYSAAHATYDYYWNTFGQCSYDADEAEVEIVTHVGQNWRNASAIGFCGTMQFGDGYSQLDIIGHEFTHLVDYNHGDLEYRGQSGALDESFADTMAAFIDGNWTVGEGIPTGALRDMSNPPRFGHPDHMLASVSGDGIGLRSTANPNANNDQGNVHTNSSIPNKAAFLATMGGTHNNYPVTALGKAKAQQLYHAVHVSVLGGDDTFLDARNALFYTASFWGTMGWNGFTQKDRCPIANAFASVGIDTANADIDCDLVPDSADPDDDGDGRPDAIDNCPTVSNIYQADLDGDGRGDACDNDDDNDGVLDVNDNCPLAANPNQADADGDGRGDVCDDSDGDGVLDPFDNCRTEPNWSQDDTDGDGVGDACDTDIDNDGKLNGNDNCPYVANADQADSDADAVGNVCDNCPSTPNPDQKDCDGNGLGAACDDGLMEVLGCLELPEAEVELWVNPLDLVALPHVALERIRTGNDIRLEVQVVGLGAEWKLADQYGRVVATPRTVTRGYASTVFTPRADYHQLDSTGALLPFGTAYRLITSPALQGEMPVEVQIRAY